MEHVFQFFIITFFFVAVYYLIHLGKQNKTFGMRVIPQMEGITEAVGRATEMGRPLFYVPGVRGVNTTDAHQTIAGLNILTQVAEQCAEKDTKLVCASMESTNMPLMEDILMLAATRAGHPEYYGSQMQVRFYGNRTMSPHFISHILKEKPAAYMYFGWCGAEDLLYIVPAARVGAMCLGGTTVMSHVGVVAAVSDYFMIGEELHAAGAYIAKDPVLLNSFVTNDIIRLFSFGMIVIGIIAISLNLADISTFSRIFNM